MHFITPLNLALLSLLGVIILLYLLKLRRKEFVVPSTLLWHQAILDLQANAPIQKLKKNLLLFLQLLILSMVVFGVARPYILTRSYQGQNLALIMDASASMNATDERPSRFERARKQALDMVDRMSMGDKMMVVLAASKTRVLSGFTSDKRALKAALAEARAHDTTSNLREAIVLALSLIKGQARSTIYILSDGALGRIPDLRVGSSAIRYLKFGKGVNNLAITALDVRRTYTTNASYQIFVTIENFSDRDRETILELYRNDKLVAPRRVTVPKAKGGRAGKHSELFGNLGFDSGLIRAQFDATDDLAADNLAYAELEPQATVKVLLVTQDNFVLERCLNVDPNIRLVRVKPSDFKPVKGFDVIIFDRNTPKSLPDTGILAIDSQPPGAPLTVRGVVMNPTIVEWDRRHPVTRWLSLGDIRISEASIAKPADWGRGIVETENGAIVVAGEKGGRRFVWCGLDFIKSTWWRRPAFPIFIHNAVRWLATAKRTSEESTQRHTGETIQVLAPESVKSVDITLPDKTTVRLVPDEKGIVSLDRTERVGPYEFKAADFRKNVGASLLNKRESNIKPRDAIDLSGGAVRAVESTRTNREIWKWLIIAALGVLCIEWFVYHRGV
jgi:hypothetical protein